MNAKVDFQQIISLLKSFVGLCSLVMITVACLPGAGVNVPYFQMSHTDLAAVAAAAAFISR